MPSLPNYNLNTKINKSPHVVILGAGASKAAFLNGDANGRLVPLMKELIDALELRPLLKKEGLLSLADDFELMYDTLLTTRPDLAQKIQKLVKDYFSCLKIPEEATIYDYLVLSLRKKDIIATFNWDPFLSQAYTRNSTVVHLPQIVFLHGNVEIAICPEHHIMNFPGNHCSKCDKLLTPTNLVYPVLHKDYFDPFIKSQWEKLEIYLNHAYLLTIFGYSAPITDIEARELMLKAWAKNTTYELAEIEIINDKSKKDVLEKWRDFICREHYTINKTIFQSYLFNHPRRSCDAFAMATMQNDPWKRNPFPPNLSLHELQNWARVLWYEENEGKFSGKTTEELLESNNLF